MKKIGHLSQHPILPLPLPQHSVHRLGHAPKPSCLYSVSGAVPNPIPSQQKQCSGIMVVKQLCTVVFFFLVFVLKFQYFKNSELVFPVNYVKNGGSCLWARSTSPFPCWRCSSLSMPQIGGQDFAAVLHLGVTVLQHSHGSGFSARCSTLVTRTCVPLNG